MADSTTMTVRLSKDLKDKLERLADSTRRSKSYLAAAAIAAYVDANVWQVDEIRKAVEQTDGGGPLVAHEDMVAYMEALARGEKPEPPNAETDRVARRLARLTGESITRAVQGAIRERLERETQRRGRHIDRARIDAITARLAALPVVDDRSPDELLDYDEAGLPR